mgnify:CR=1 FL=1|jgi:uncharacterized membrane protein
MNVRQLELFVSNVLRFGVMASGILIMFGLGLYMVTGDISCPTGDSSLQWILYGDPFFAPSHILFLGFLTLVATPLLRVAASTLAYVVEKDWAYAAITGFVLTVLLIGIVLGLG